MEEANDGIDRVKEIGRAQEYRDEPGGVFEAIRRVIAELPAIPKASRNNEQRFNFRGIDDVLNALSPLLAKHGVFFVPDVVERIEGQRTTRSNNALYVVNLHVRYTFYGTDGSSVVASGWGEGTDSGDKATNKAMTGAMKYVLGQIFAIASSGQADADEGSPEDSRPRDLPVPLTDQQKQKILDSLRRQGLDLAELLEKSGLETIDQLSADFAQKWIARLDEREAELQSGPTEDPELPTKPAEQQTLGPIAREARQGEAPPYTGFGGARPVTDAPAIDDWNPDVLQMETAWPEEAEEISWLIRHIGLEEGDLLAKHHVDSWTKLKRATAQSTIRRLRVLFAEKFPDEEQAEETSVEPEPAETKA